MFKDVQHINLTDEDLLTRYRQQGNPEWLGYLLQRYTLLLLGVAMKYLKDKEQAQDAVQQIFLKALTHLPSGEIMNLKGWLYVLMRNYCLQILRDKSYKVSEEVLTQISAPTYEKEELEWKEHTLEQMEESMKELNEDQRNALIRFYLKKQSYQEIMDQTGYSFMQVKSHIQNGKRNLKLLLLKKLGNNQP